MLNRFSSLIGRKILILGDSDQIACLLRDVFVSCGAGVTTVSTGLAAIVRLEAGCYDLVILDLASSRPDGWDVVCFMRRLRPGLLGRTILLTGDFHRPQTMRAIRNTHLPVIFKPFDVEKLRATACKLLCRNGALPAA
ncbi:MAG: response regulator [Planctomycetota bacterium]|nr:response regulator [Planctomycetota bacterium]